MRPGSGRTQSERLASALAEDILAGRLKPGARLQEKPLSARFGISRTPVREGLRQLAATGLVDMRPHRSTLGPPPQHPRHCREARAAGRAVCRHGRAGGELREARGNAQTGYQRSQLWSLHGAMADIVHRGDVDAYDHADCAFHAAVYAGAHNGVLVRHTSTLRRRLNPLRHARFLTPGRLPESFAEHEVVLPAILGRDAAAAYDAMLSHMRHAGEAFAEYVANLAPDGLAPENLASERGSSSRAIAADRPGSLTAERS